jgi:hypothetical protein
MVSLISPLELPSRARRMPLSRLQEEVAGGRRSATPRSRQVVSFPHFLGLAELALSFQCTARKGSPLAESLPIFSVIGVIRGQSG